MNDFPDGPILVALSGGVDSAVAAILLKEQGLEVSGVYVRTWEHEEDVLGDCPGAQDLRDARAVAALLDIPFRVVNFIDFYQCKITFSIFWGTNWALNCISRTQRKSFYLTGTYINIIRTWKIICFHRS